jgi:hypothetical protein
MLPSWIKSWIETPHAGIVLGDRNNETKVAVDQLVFRFDVALGDSLGEINFLVTLKVEGIAPFG